MSYTILNGDAFELIKQQPDNSVDLVLTSPPYADIVNYGKNISIQKPKEYVDWLLPLFSEIYRVLKPSGSFILNINDNCHNGYRNTFVYELIYRSQKETPLKFYDTYIWHKMNGIPNGGKKRFRNTSEFIFHFVKDKKHLKFYMDRVLQEPAELTQKRRKYPWNIKGHGEIVDGARGNKIEYNAERLPEKVRPDNVFRFPTAGLARDNHIKHPAPFYKDLPAYFIKFLTDEGDIVLDTFSGIGTTGLPCIETNRNFIGYELNENYAEFAHKRLGGNELEDWVVCQYDTEGNLLGVYKNRDEAARVTGVESGDIMRTYNRTKFTTRGGYVWKLERNNVINQFDMDDKFIRSWNSITEIENTLGFDSHNHIEDCIRKGNSSSYGFKWKMGKRIPDTEYLINQYDMDDNYIASFNGITSAANSIGYSTPHNIMMCYRGFRTEAGGYKWKLEKK
jgi:site-specific DNA-methyltransferase (adenine-specific)